MRSVVVAAAVGVMAQTAYAADMPDYGPLRGALVETSRVVNWDGFYVGGQAGYGTSDMDFTDATSSLAHQQLVLTAMESEFNVSRWPVLGKRSSHGSGFGAFLGYNWQWDDVVLGLEANYMHGNFGGSDSGGMARFFTTSNGYTNDVYYSAGATMNVKDIGSVRARAAYAFGSFLPYAFGGVSLGQADIVRTASISGTQINTGAAPGFQVVPINGSLTQVENNHFIYGYAGGVGMDMMITRGLFLRAEWEYLKFAAPINTAVSTVRAGLGYKF